MIEINKKAHIGFFLPSLSGGGSERVFVNLANEFSSRGFKIDFILAKKEGPYLVDVNKNINIIDFKSKRVLFSLFPLIKYLRKKKPKVLISSMEYVNIIAILAKVISGSKTRAIIRVANAPSEYLQKIKPSKRFLLLYGSMFFYRFADIIIALPERVVDDLVKIFKISRNKIKILYNPTVTAKLLEKSKEKPKNLQFNKKNQPIILAVGRLNIQKDFPTLIKAFAELRKKREAKLIILGEGKERGSLEKLTRKLKIENDIDLPGFTDNPYPFMAHADIFVLSSIFEGFGNVLIEAMSLGTPVVSTDCPNGPAELLGPIVSEDSCGIKNGKYGKLVPVGNYEMLAKAIEETLDNPIDPELLKLRANDFHVEKIADDYLRAIGFK